jgi:hypothetical protein
MKRLLFAAICVYAPHLLEEYLTRMWDDPLLAPALHLFAGWSVDHAVYCMFQVMFALLCITVLAFSYAGRPRNLVMTAFAVALLAESHHAIRFLISHQYNSGLVTSFAMPIVGALIFRKLFTKEKISCSSTSSSPWASGASRSV